MDRKTNKPIIIKFDTPLPSNLYFQKKKTEKLLKYTTPLVIIERNIFQK